MRIYALDAESHLYFSKQLPFSSARSMKLDSQLHLGYFVGIYASDAEFHLYFWQNVPFFGLILSMFTFCV